MTSRLYGLVAEFADAEGVLQATRQAYDVGYRRMDAYTPYAVEGLAEALGHKKNAVPLITLLCGLIGGATAYGTQWYAATIHYPLDVGGRPLHSWPMFIPITFELTVLFASLGAVLSMLILNGLPRLHHPIFETPHFEVHSHYHFYLCIESRDARFDPAQTRAFLERFKPETVWEVSE